MNRLITILFALLIASAATAQSEKTQNKKKLDKQVRADVEGRLDDQFEVTDVNFTETYIMVEADDGKVIKRTFYTPVGEFEETITEASYSALPKGVQTAFMASNFSHSDIQEVFFVETLTEEFFALKLLREGEVRYLFINDNGEELKRPKKLLFMTEV